jgi:hypothetical protein
MSMKRFALLILISNLIVIACFSQEKENSGVRILFHGIVMDATTLTPISNSQILINRKYSAIANPDGRFAFFVNIRDSVLFKHLGYKPTLLYVSDTLAGKDFVAGIFMNSDTLSIGEVVIIPRFNNLKSLIMNSPSKVPATMDNARYNVAVSGYQGRTTQGKLMDPAANYSLLRQKMKVNAYEKGGIPSDMIAGFSSILMPAAYLLIHGTPERAGPFEQDLTSEELNQINKRFLESLQENK